MPTPITLAELAEEFGVSREHVRQVEVRAFEKVQGGGGESCGGGSPLTQLALAVP